MGTMSSISLLLLIPLTVSILPSLQPPPGEQCSYSNKRNNLLIQHRRPLVNYSKYRLCRLIRNFELTRQVDTMISDLGNLFTDLSGREATVVRSDQAYHRSFGGNIEMIPKFVYPYWERKRRCYGLDYDVDSDCDCDSDGSDHDSDGYWSD